MDKKSKILDFLKQIEDEVKLLEHRKEALDIAVQKRISEIKKGETRRPSTSSSRRTTSVSRSSKPKYPKDSEKMIKSPPKTKDTSNQSEREKDSKSKPPNRRRPHSVRYYKPKVNYNV